MSELENQSKTSYEIYRWFMEPSEHFAIFSTYGYEEYQIEKEKRQKTRWVPLEVVEKFFSQLKKEEK